MSTWQDRHRLPLRHHGHASCFTHGSQCFSYRSLVFVARDDVKKMGGADEESIFYANMTKRARWRRPRSSWHEADARNRRDHKTVTPHSTGSNLVIMSDTPPLMKCLPLGAHGIMARRNHHRQFYSWYCRQLGDQLRDTAPRADACFEDHKMYANDPSLGSFSSWRGADGIIRSF